MESAERRRHRFAFKHAAKLESSLDNMPASFRHPGSTRPTRIELDGRSALGRLRAVMEETGTPGDGARLSSSARSQVYDESVWLWLERDVVVVVWWGSELIEAGSCGTIMAGTLRASLGRSTRVRRAK
jgi:hypothetical protein